MRGIEVTLQGIIRVWMGNLPGRRWTEATVRFAQLAADDKIQWNHAVRTLQPLEGGESLVYEGLAAASRK